MHVMLQMREESQLKRYKLRQHHRDEIPAKMAEEAQQAAWDQTSAVEPDSAVRQREPVRTRSSAMSASPAKAAHRSSSDDSRSGTHRNVMSASCAAKAHADAFRKVAALAKTAAATASTAKMKTLRRSVLQGMLWLCLTQQQRQFKQPIANLLRLEQQPTAVQCLPGLALQIKEQLQAEMLLCLKAC